MESSWEYHDLSQCRLRQQEICEVGLACRKSATSVAFRYQQPGILLKVLRIGNCGPLMPSMQVSYRKHSTSISASSQSFVWCYFGKPTLCGHHYGC